MKKPDELGISPYPWIASLGNNQLIITRGTAQTFWLDYHFELQHANRTMRYANAHLIEAAPELYEAGYEVILDKCKKCVWSNRDPENKCEFTGKCSVKNMRAALAKAAGEDS